ncbi:MAG TPA: response regulator transcription factor [Gammaproteobacteria bacterium]|jgi:DNA-binding response OmpR family regulator|nr:response regulator transcription factor [Gammaproteobacteria bacterium]
MRVLIVEDELRMAEQLRRGLEREGYTVLVAADGQHGLELARTVEHELLILDWMLPKLDGLEVARRLRQARVDTRILMLTARDAPPDVVEGLDGGADDYLIKPFAFEVLLARLRALARRTPTTQPPVLTVLDLHVDPAAHRVHRGGTEIKLSTKEFSLLHFLIRRAGQTVPRETLIGAVWGFESSIESNTLDAFIHLLRSKVDAPPHDKLIHTVRGVGYCLRATPP